MRGSLITFAVVMAVLPLAHAHEGQEVVIDESKIRAVLKNESTHISVPLESASNRAVRADLSLCWVDVNDRAIGLVHQDITIEHGRTSVDVPLPIPNSRRWLRLRYALAPDRSDARAFVPQGGILALSHIADHVFEIKYSYAGTPRPGKPLVVHAQAVHPVTRVGVANVRWNSTLEIGERELSPVRTQEQEGGHVEFTFAIPVAASDPAVVNEAEEQMDLSVSGTLGDFDAEASETVRLQNRLSARLQTDKPIYQPGQAVHVRAIVLDAQERAAAGAKVVLRIEDDQGERVHTSHLSASRFGVVHDDWTLPGGSNLGAYAITLTSETDENYQVGHHVIRVSRYELPTFKVVAKPDRSAYLPGEQVDVSITGTYFFGKPVPKGKVKLTRSGETRRRTKTKEPQNAEEVLSEGEAGEDGTFIAHLDLRADHEKFKDREEQRFEDVHLAAYYTDPSSGRTEQRRFDVRITREAIHVYVLLAPGGGSLPHPVYVSTDYADGTPASALVELSYGAQKAKVQTNRYGVGKAFLAKSGDDDDEVVARAVDNKGLKGTWTEHYWRPESSSLHLETSRTLYRAGESVTLQISTPAVFNLKASAESFVLVYAIAGERPVTVRVVRLVNGKGQITFPYQPEFRRVVTFAAWNAESGADPTARNTLASRAVIFPDASDLQVDATTERSTYRPGEKATLRMRVRSQDGKPVDAALGLAVVDQAVLERARTDSEFGHRRWFQCAFCPDEGESGIGGVRLNDLYALKPSTSFSPELDLVAEALVARTEAFVRVESSEAFRDPPSFSSIQGQKERLRRILEEHYRKTLEFPRDSASLDRISWQWRDMRDPWGSAYSAVFEAERNDHVLRLISPGPDKQTGTADDFTAARFSQSYIEPRRFLIQEILSRQDDYPGSNAEFRNLLSENGLLIDSLRDPWGTPYRAQVATLGPRREIAISSAGPDRTFGTKDDFVAMEFAGTYFTRETAAISRALDEAPRPPQTLEEFQRALSQAGVDVSSYRDPWGNPFRATSVISSRYNDRVTSKMSGVYGSAPVRRTTVTPVTEQLITFALHSSGPDGLEGTRDDFDIVQFPTVLRQDSGEPEPAVSSTNTGVRSAGIITGTVTDSTGAAVPGTTILLTDSRGQSYKQTVGSDGVYVFTSIPRGFYSLRATATGFMSHEVSQIPVTGSSMTTVDIELQVGSLNQMVTVEAALDAMNTEMAEMTSVAAAVTSMSTPRVREYFPETLVWLPEIVTDEHGIATTQFNLADSVTTWKVAAIASTSDGRVAEVESELRSFQPLFLDFNPPLILTEGDQIDLPVTVRNYEDREEKVSIKAEPNDWSLIQGSPVKDTTVPANSSVNVNYRLHAKTAREAAKERITAAAGRSRDAIEKSIRVHPDGQESTHTTGDMIMGQTAFSVMVPTAAVRSALHGELRLYPNIASLLIEGATAILATPYGCAEQRISAGYANLIALRSVRAVGITNSKIEKTALTNIKAAADILPAFQTGDGGVRYWDHGEADTGVTSYALHFLIDASEMVGAEKTVLQSMVHWLEKHQAIDGQWVPPSRGQELPKQRAVMLTSLVVRSLAAAQKAGLEVQANVLAGGYHHIAQSSDEMDEPYILAQFILAALESGDEALLGNAAQRLAALAREEKGGVYWDLRTNTPFYGWGTAGRVETTGLAVSALSAWRKHQGQSTEFDSVIRRGLVFLLRGRDRYGSWYSTQSTVRAMRAVADASAVLGTAGGSGGQIEVRVNGRSVRSVSMPNDAQIGDPLIVDVSAFLAPGENRVELTPSTGSRMALMLFASTYWLPWNETQPRNSAELRLEVKFDHLEASTGQAIQCAVHAERVGFKGYGMMLAEIGLPPGAEVDRASLEAVIENSSGVDQYDVLPDRVIFYLWPEAGGASFQFKLSARTPMMARSATSILYDYYNPEILSEVVPARWAVH